MKKFLLTLLLEVLSLLLAFGAHAQTPTSYVELRAYDAPGKPLTTCGRSFAVVEDDGVETQTVAYTPCRTMAWSKSTGSAVRVFHWNGKRWTSARRAGTFYYFKWIKNEAYAKRKPWM